MTLTRPDRTTTPELQTEYDFVLPRGHLDDRGRRHRAGSMRLATARDEIAPQADPRVRSNPAYLTVLLLARTVTRLDGVADVDTGVIEGLFAADLAFLQDLYRQLNQEGDDLVACPRCGHVLAAGGGEGVGEP